METHGYAGNYKMIHFSLIVRNPKDPNKEYVLHEAHNGQIQLSNEHEEGMGIFAHKLYDMLDKYWKKNF